MSDYEYYFKKALEILLEMDVLDDNASIGVAKQIIGQGLGSLSERQFKVYQHSLCNEVEELQECEGCGEDIPLEDLQAAYEYDSDKFMCVDCRETDWRINNS
nr:hypothetical protein [uncultured Pseudodesulfovibrio sp.]